LIAKKVESWCWGLQTPAEYMAGMNEKACQKKSGPVE